jgi:hypothetical protein
MNEPNYIREKYEVKRASHPGERSWQIFVGLVIFLLSGAYFFLVVAVGKKYQPEGIVDAIGIALLLELYMIPATVGLFLALKYILGPSNWLNRKIASSLAFMWILIGLSSVFLVAPVLFFGSIF